MANLSNHSPIAVAYARSLLELANEGQVTREVATELLQLGQLIQDNPTFGLFMADPAISHEERAGILQRIFQGRVQPLIFSFLAVLNRHGRLAMLAHMIGAYGVLLDIQAGIINVDLTVAAKVDDRQLEEIRRQISAALGKQAVVSQYVDDSIIGGMVLRVDDRLIDGSVRGQLQALKTQMLAAAQQA